MAGCMHCAVCASGVHAGVGAGRAHPQGFEALQLGEGQVERLPEQGLQGRLEVHHDLAQRAEPLRLERLGLGAAAQEGLLLREAQLLRVVQPQLLRLPPLCAAKP